MVSVKNQPIYDALPISNDALDKGGVELLRAAIVDEKLFVMARRDAFLHAGPWGFVLADIARRLASLYAAKGNLTEAKVTAGILDTFEFSFRRLGASTARDPDPHRLEGRGGAKPAKSARSRARVASRAKSKPSTKAVARRKGARPKP
jgi:hypothetical protein